MVRRGPNARFRLYPGHSRRGPADEEPDNPSHEADSEKLIALRALPSTVRRRFLSAAGAQQYKGDDGSLQMDGGALLAARAPCQLADRTRLQIRLSLP